MAGLYLDEMLADNVRKYYCASYEAQKEYHEKMLASIVESARSSPVYSGMLPDAYTIERLNDIPMTCWDDIESAMEKHGLDGTLLSKPVRYWQTSGYSGNPKKIYYGNADIERIHLYILEMLYVTGVFESDAGILNVGVADPYLPGTLFDDCFKKYGNATKYRAGYLSCSVIDEKGFIDALKSISKADDMTVMLSFPVMYYLIARASVDIDALEEKVAATIARLNFLPAAVLPHAISKKLAKFYLRDVDFSRLNDFVKTVKFGYVYGEPLGPYEKFIEKCYSSIKLFNVLGSTEMLMQAFHVSGGYDEMSVPLKHYIPEIASPEGVAAAKSDPERKLNATPWYCWTKGMKGELIITKPGECLPLIRYPTGDYIEVVDPARKETITIRGVEYDITLPVIRVLGRTSDMVDFDSPDQSGTFFGFKFYSKNLDDAMQRAGNVKWWEFYKLHGSPGRYMLWVIPEMPVKDIDRYKKTIIASLLKAPEDQAVSFSLAKDLDVLDLVVGKPEAYGDIEKDIERRVREGRPLGRIKPRHIHKLDDESEYVKVLNEKKRQAA